MQQMRIGGCWCLTAITLVALGCGGDTGPKTYPVSGTVTRNGSPVEGVAVSFVPDGGGETAVGVTDASGKYTLTTRKQGDGAVPGKYKVTLAKYEGGGGSGAVTDPSQVKGDLDNINDYPADYDEAKASQGAVSKNLLPAKYADPNQSGLTAEITEGQNTKDFTIEG